MKVKITQKYIYTAIKVIITTLAIGYLGYSLMHIQNLGSSFNLVYNSITNDMKPLYYFISVVLLMPINWGLEALKWFNLSKKHYPISYFDCFKGVLSGVTLSYITPHGIGDYAARLYFLKGESKEKAIGNVFLSRIAQFYVTFFYGLLGYIIFYNFYNIQTSVFNINLLFVLSILIVLALLGLINLGYLLPLLSRIPLSNKIIPYFELIATVSLSDFCLLFFVSIFRFIIFSFQYILVLLMFEIQAFDILIVSGIWLIFLTKSILPGFNFLNDLGIREAAAIYFLGELDIPKAILIASSVTVWIVNIVVPMFFGLIVIAISKINPSKSPDFFKR
ncbi:MAG: lysylphosphatidylglycerol synthase domain-containing protein [Bacteroidota bacterium]|nr:lysylphosphatidylglycerol synthase domain-containing protein [Bacteroidota bacterium]